MGRLQFEFGIIIVSDPDYRESLMCIPQTSHLSMYLFCRRPE